MQTRRFGRSRHNNKARACGGKQLVIFAKLNRSVPDSTVDIVHVADNDADDFLRYVVYIVIGSDSESVRCLFVLCGYYLDSLQYALGYKSAHDEHIELDLLRISCRLVKNVSARPFVVGQIYAGMVER